MTKSRYTYFHGDTVKIGFIECVVTRAQPFCFKDLFNQPLHLQQITVDAFLLFLVAEHRRCHFCPRQGRTQFMTDGEQ